MATKAFHIRIDAKQKKRLEELFERMGLDVPTAVRMFFRKVEVTERIPFVIGELDTDDNWYTPADVKRWEKIARDAKKGKGIAASFQLPEESKSMHQWLRSL